MSCQDWKTWMISVICCRQIGHCPHNSLSVLAQDRHTHMWWHGQSTLSRCLSMHTAHSHSGPGRRRKTIIMVEMMPEKVQHSWWVRRLSCQILFSGLLVCVKFIVIPNCCNFSFKIAKESGVDLRRLLMMPPLLFCLNTQTRLSDEWNDPY